LNQQHIFWNALRRKIKPATVGLSRKRTHCPPAAPAYDLPRLRTLCVWSFVFQVVPFWAGGAAASARKTRNTAITLKIRILQPCFLIEPRTIRNNKEEFSSMKKVFSALLAASMMLGLAACGASGSSSAAPAADSTPAADSAAATGDVASDPHVKLVYAEVNPLDTIVGQTATAFKEKVEELSGGSIEIDIQASGVLGSENDVLDNILAGGDTIDLSRISAFALTSYGCKKSMLLSIPFTFENRTHFWNFANSDLAPEFLNEPQDLGLPVRGVFYGEEGFRHFFTTKEISSMGDLAGMKLRVSNDPVMNGMVEGLGASPTVVSFGELYSALQTGVVDGAEQPIANYKSNAFNEVANNLILDGHTLGAVQVVITDNAWSKLTAAQQECIMEAGKYAQDFNANLSETEENKVLEDLKASGCNVVDVADKNEWAAACADVIAENTKDQAELYQKILDLKG